MNNAIQKITSQIMDEVSKGFVRIKVATSASNIFTMVPKEWRKIFRYKGAGEESALIDAGYTLQNPRKILSVFDPKKHIAIIGMTADNKPAFMFMKSDYSEGKFQGYLPGEESHIREKTPAGYSHRTGQPRWNYKSDFALSALVGKVPTGDYKVYFLTTDENRVRLKEERQKLNQPVRDAVISRETIFKFLKKRIGDRLDFYAQEINKSIQQLMNEMTNALDGTGKVVSDKSIDELANKIKKVMSVISTLKSRIPEKGFRSLKKEKGYSEGERYEDWDLRYFMKELSGIDELINRLQ